MVGRLGQLVYVQPVPHVSAQQNLIKAGRCVVVSLVQSKYDVLLSFLWPHQEAVWIIFQEGKI